MRLIQLDVLRAVAVFMVIFRHITLGRDNAGLHHFVEQTLSSAPTDLAHLHLVVIRSVYQAGWAGVDLFFVLSGYLVSGLLFAEYRRYGKLRVGRFLLRRGLKIYPAFYVFLALGAAATIATHKPRPAMAWLSEALFIQNYGPNIWGHTWSLAVEEHFYLLLALLLWVMAKRGGPDPFRRLPWLFLGVTATVTTLRVLTYLSNPEFDYRTHYFPTHLRVDALFFGAVLSYLSHFQPHRLAFVRERAAIVLPVSALLVLPIYLVDQLDPRMYLVGLPLLYLGNGGLLLSAVGSQRFARWPLSLLTRPMAYVGERSYSIYLWHAAVVSMGVPVAVRMLHLREPSALVEFLIYVPTCLIVGIGMARLVELPVLALRDRLMPARDAGPSVVTVEEPGRAAAGGAG